MKTLVIPDVHGRKNWKKYIEHTEWDQVVFIGDYFDSLDILPNDQIENFKEILKFKNQHPGKVFLLCGNHELHYLIEGQVYTGYQSGISSIIYDLLRPLHRKEELIACKKIGNFLLTHAGVTLTWCHEWDISHHNLEESINDMFLYKPIAFAFQSGYDPRGNNVFQSPMWVRPHSLKNDRVLDVVHVVGHTVQDKINFEKDVWLIDAMGTSDEALIIEDNIASPVKLWVKNFKL